MPQGHNTDWGLGQYDVQGASCGLNSAFDYLGKCTIKALKMHYCKGLTRREYRHMNTLSLQYFLLLTSGG